MRLTLLFLLTLNFYASFGQVLCDDSQIVDQYGDYPPGCNMCIPFVGGDNIGYTSDDTISYDFPCGEVENSIWYSFYSREAGEAFFKLFTSACKFNKGVEVAIFDENLKRISDCISVGNNEDGRLEVELPARQLFHIMIDGVDGDECQFGLFNNLPTSNSNYDIYMNTNNVSFCVGAEVCFARDRDFALEEYEWKIPASDSIVGGGINEEEICVHFKTIGTKEIVLNISSPCLDQQFSEPVEVTEGQSLSIESFTSSTDLYCEGEEVQFDVGWNNDSIGLYWFASASEFTKIAGGEPTDTFYRGIIKRDGDIEIIVAPRTFCGLSHVHFATAKATSNQFVSRFVCNEGCYTIGDSCYNFTGGFRTHFVNVGENQVGCDSFIFLSLSSTDILPSPDIKCQQTNNGVLIEWDRVSGAEHYVVFANRDSIATVMDGSYFIENGSIQTPSLTVKVQPIGECTYLPAEISCSDFVSNTSTNFLTNKISIYPNPTTGNLNIETDLQIEEIDIFDVSGRFLQKEKRTSFELKNPTAGIYFVKIKTDEGVVTKRILMNK